MNTIYKDPQENFSDIARGRTSKLNFYFNFGIQSWLSKSFSIDVYCGFGLGFHTDTSYNLDSQYSNGNYVYSWFGHYDSRAVYVANFGIKVGIGSKGKQ